MPTLGRRPASGNASRRHAGFAVAATHCAHSFLIFSCVGAFRTIGGIETMTGRVLFWPAMTMGFKVANAALLQGLKPGAAVAFEFVERQPGDWVVTAIKPAANGHTGH